MRNQPPGFFFSSRRRHTSSTRDWSSDVCSSDLAAERSDWRFSLPPPIILAPIARPSKKRGSTMPRSSASQIGRASCRESVSKTRQALRSAATYYSVYYRQAVENELVDYYEIIRR